MQKGNLEAFQKVSAALFFNHFTQKSGKVEPAYICFLILHFVILFYNIFRLVYFHGIRLAARWNPKAKLWTEGRNNWQQTLQQQPQRNGTDVTVWMHCASLGEFEQGRPVLEKIKTSYPHVRVVLTFFSPSGYEVRKGFTGADIVMYLPDDSKENAVTFLDLVEPSLAIFVKYEFWHFYLAELKKRGIETVLVSGIFRSTQPFFQWWGGFHKNMLQQFSHLFVQNQPSASLLASIHIQNNVTVCGDTRFDRVIEAAQQWQPISSIDHVIDPNKKVLVAGSTWKDDEELIAQWYAQHKHEWQLIIVPHEINEKHLIHVQQLFGNAVLFSDLNTETSETTSYNCILVNTIGHLSKLYKYGTVCYVGGGFTKSGIHNTLEAAVYNKAVITGPNIKKYREATELQEAGGLITIETALELKDTLHRLDFDTAGKKAGNYVQQHAGATAAIMNYIQEKRLLTKA